MTHEICSHCKKAVEMNKGFTVSFYRGKREQEFRCCSVACVDAVIKGQKST